MRCRTSRCACGLRCQASRLRRRHPIAHQLLEVVEEVDAGWPRSR
ncbi:hypothetical protein I552_0303 [Mycobacterium xenopi 3993]|nr:hypothetical protein I552_0303 [Mycobacterium xenopi 3993]